MSEKCVFPFDFDETKKRQCIEFSQLQVGGDQVPGPEDEGDSLYCKTPQGKGKGMYASWSWGLCNDACLSDEGCKLL